MAMVPKMPVKCVSTLYLKSWKLVSQGFAFYMQNNDHKKKKKTACYLFPQDGYECQCCPGFIGPHCEEQDACYPSPCQNHGICVDISQGHDGTTFQCLCPYGKSEHVQCNVIQEQDSW